MEQGEYRTCRRLSTEGLSDVFELYAQELGSSTNAETKSLFEAAYLKHDNLGRHTPMRIHFWNIRSGNS
jgi:hypothetical protein